MNREKTFFLILFILIFVIYGQSLWGTFVYDDRGIIEHWNLLSQLGNIKEVLTFPYWTVEAGLYRPITLLSHSLNIIFFGGSAFSFHLINLLLYFGICVSIFVLVKKLFRREMLAYLTAIIFLILPIHTEVVANITGRSELLALFFSLLALCEFTKEKMIWWRAGLWVFLAIGAKESAIAVLPLILFVVFIKEQFFNLEIVKKYFRSFSAVLIGTLIYFVLRFLMLGVDHFVGVETSLIENPLIFADTTGRIATALQILWMYVMKTFVPINLCSDYSYNQIPVLDSFWHLGPILGVIMILLAIISFFVFIHRRSVIAFGSAIFLTSFIMVSNIFFTTGTIAGERLFFFPSLGFALILAYLLTPSASSTSPLLRGRLVGVYVLIAIYGVLALHRQSFWLTEEKLFMNAVECAPQSVLSRSNAGATYYFEGDLENAQRELELSREIKPIYSKGLNNLGLVYWKQGKISEAKAMFHESLKQTYPYSGALENLVLIYTSEKDYESADRWLKLFGDSRDSF